MAKTVPGKSESSEHFELLRRLDIIEDSVRKQGYGIKANGRKLDLLLSKSADEKEIAALTAELKASETALSEAVKAATPSST